MAESKFVSFMRDLLNITEYESEATKYMRDFMAQHPEEFESQKKGRGVWWDKDAKAAKKRESFLGALCDLGVNNYPRCASGTKGRLSGPV